MTDLEMLALARQNLDPVIRGEHCATGFVSAVLEGANGKYYTGVNIDLACGLGFCAERAAAAAMIDDGECVVRRAVCVDKEGAPMTPCGSCREFLMLLSPANAGAVFYLGKGKRMTLAQFLPLPWENYGQGDNA